MILTFDQHLAAFERANHTGTQPIDTIEGLEQTLSSIPIFDTEEEGRASVSNDQYFYADSDDPNVSKTLWQRVSSSESRFIADEPSVGIFSEVNRQRGTLPDGADLSDAQLPGVYLLIGGNNYTGMPPEADPGLSYYLNCRGSGDPDGKGGSRFVLQELIGFLPRRNNFQTWKRRLDNNIPNDNPDWTYGPRNNAEIFAQRGNLQAGTALSSAAEPGTWLMRPNQDYTEVPDAFDQTRAYFLDVFPIGPVGSETGYGITRHGRQVITDFLAPSDGSARRQWERRFDTTNPGTSGGNDWTETRFQFDSVSDGVFLGRGTLPDGADFADYLIPGCWLGLPRNSYLSAPDRVVDSSAFWLEVSITGGRFVKQTITAHNSDYAGTPTAQKTSLTRRVDSNNPTDTTGTSTWTVDSPILPGTQPFSGASVVCFGDSVTQGKANFEYPTRLANLTGADVVNGGFGGCRMAVHDSSSVGYIYDPFCMYQLSEILASGDWQSLLDSAAVKDAETGGTRFTPIAQQLADTNWNSVDYITIAYGTNDFRGTGGMGVPIGSDSDMTGDTFKGAINLTINNIVSAYPGIKILFVTPLWRSRIDVSGEDSNVTPNGSGVFLSEYVDAIIDRARVFQIPVLNLHNECSINILNWEHYIPDGLHPYTDAGMDLMARKFSGGLSRYY